MRHAHRFVALLAGSLAIPGTLPAQTLGSLGLSGGLGRNETGASIGGRIGGAIALGRLEFGPEYGVQRFGRSDRVTDASLALRFVLRAARLRSYVVVNGGAYGWSSLTRLFGVGVGGGIEFGHSGRPRPRIGVESRWHTPLQRFDQPAARFRFVTLHAVFRLSPR